MFDNFVNGYEPGDYAAGIPNREELLTRAAEPNGRLLAGTAPHEACQQCEARVSASMRVSGAYAFRRDFSMPGNIAAAPMVEWIERWGCSLAILSLLLSPPGAFLSAAPRGDQSAHLSARDLVKEVTRKEERARKNPRNYYKFVQKEKTPDGAKISIQIETPKGAVGEAISINGKPPSRKQCRTEAESLRKLATDSQVLQRLSQEQKEQTDRIERLMTAVPQAFIFRYKEKQQGSKRIEITFRPNPRFHPQSNEASLLRGMRGTLQVDPASHRLAKIDATLFKDVNFGWGFLASLHRGGHFSLQQSRVSGGSWKETFLEVDLDGSKLVFGQIHVHFKDSSQSFVRLANPPSLAEAVDMLGHSATVCREVQTQGITTQAQLH